MANVLTDVGRDPEVHAFPNINWRTDNTPFDAPNMYHNDLEFVSYGLFCEHDTLLLDYGWWSHSQPIGGASNRRPPWFASDVATRSTLLSSAFASAAEAILCHSSEVLRRDMVSLVLSTDTNPWQQRPRQLHRGTIPSESPIWKRDSGRVSAQDQRGTDARSTEHYLRPCALLLRHVIGDRTFNSRGFRRPKRQSKYAFSQPPNCLTYLGHLTG